MKNFKFLAVSLFILIIAVPSISYFFSKNKTSEPEKKDGVFNLEISVYRTESGKVETINCYDYMCGVVAGEMPASYEAEALKAQTVAAFTYTVNKMEYVKENPDSDIGHNGAYVCDDYTHCKAYLSKDDALSKWGDEWFDKYYTSIEDSVSAVLGKIITFDGKPVNAVFHAISNGTTCSAKEVWDTEVNYLQSVDSVDDKLARDYESKVTLTHKDFADVFYEELGVTLPDEYNNWIGDITYADSGMVEEIVVSDTAYSGTHIRKLFSLRSATFDIDITKNDVIFTVYGYGHGVGMSQYGANEMAKKGSTYADILKHYYSGVEIEDFKI